MQSLWHAMQQRLSQERQASSSSALLPAGGAGDGGLAGGVGASGPSGLMDADLSSLGVGLVGGLGGDAWALATDGGLFAYEADDAL